MAEPTAEELAATAAAAAAADEAAPKRGKRATVSVILLRDTWIGEERMRASPEPMDLPTAAARALIDAGVAQRNDPLPGE